MLDRKLIANGILARGNVVSAVPDGITIGQDSNLAYGAEKVCRVVIEVIDLHGEEPYEASCKHSIPLIYIPRLQEKGAAVAVRVDPDDPQHIERDLGTDVPPAPVILVSDDRTSQTLEASKSTYTAAEILQQGAPCTVDVLAVIPLNQLASDGEPRPGSCCSCIGTASPTTGPRSARTSRCRGREGRRRRHARPAGSPGRGCRRTSTPPTRTRRRLPPTQPVLTDSADAVRAKAVLAQRVGREHPRDGSRRPRTRRCRAPRAPRR